MERHFHFVGDVTYAPLHSKRLVEVSELVRQVTEGGLSASSSKGYEAGNTTRAS